MGPLFKNTYRIQSARWQGWNYGWNGWYFVTICTDARICYFGRVVDNKMVLSNIGLIVRDEWLKTTFIRTNVLLDEWVIMPNHVHMIIRIFNPDDDIETRVGVETHSYASLQRGQTAQPIDYKNTFGPQRRNISSIVRGFKGAVTTRITTAYGHGIFAWQPRFHDHIIRDEFELNRIRKYVRENPAKWEEDTFYVPQ